MKVNICSLDGTSSIGLITGIVNRTLFARVPGLAGITEFRYNLGDWISPSGLMISCELCEQPPATRVSLRLAQASPN
jgi:hypothetical protein